MRPKRTKRTIRAIGILFGSAALLAACGEEAEKPVEYVRAIKTFTVSEVASGQTRKYAATVQATNSSALSFQVAGNVQKVLVKAGDAVRKGQILAVLDKKPYELDVQAAQAELRKAEADRGQKRSELERQKALFAKGWIAKSRLEQHQSAYESAVGQVNIATSKLSLARRDLANTELAAPFAGADDRITPSPAFSARQLEAWPRHHTSMRRSPAEAARTTRSTP